MESTRLTLASLYFDTSKIPAKVSVNLVSDKCSLHPPGSPHVLESYAHEIPTAWSTENSLVSTLGHATLTTSTPLGSYWSSVRNFDLRSTCSSPISSRFLTACNMLIRTAFPNKNGIILPTNALKQGKLFIAALAILAKLLLPLTWRRLICISTSDFFCCRQHRSRFPSMH